MRRSRRSAPGADPNGLWSGDGTHLAMSDAEMPSVKLDRRWLLAPPLLAVLLVAVPTRLGELDSRALLVVLGALALVVAAIGVARQPRRPERRPRPEREPLARSGPLAIRHTQELGSGARLVVIRFQDRDLLVAEGRDGGVRLLAEGAHEPEEERSRDSLEREVEVARAPETAPAGRRLEGYRTLARTGR